MFKRLSVLGGAVVVSILAGCGGGGGSPASSGTPAADSQSGTGLWIGTTTTSRTVTGVVLGDGTYYVIYSGVGQPTNIAGVVQGKGAITGSNTFSSTDGRDFNLEGYGITSANISATAKTKQTLIGTVNYPNSSTSFSSTYDSNFEVTPTLATVAGSYTGTVTTSLGYESASVSVSSSGVVAGISQSGCSVSGTVTPRTDGNVYDFALTFGGSPCYFAGQTFNGISYYNASAKRLYSAAPNASRTDGVFFVGVKP